MGRSPLRLCLLPSSCKHREKNREAKAYRWRPLQSNRYDEHIQVGIYAYVWIACRVLHGRRNFAGVHTAQGRRKRCPVYRVCEEPVGVHRWHLNEAAALSPFLFPKIPRSLFFIPVLRLCLLLAVNGLSSRVFSDDPLFGRETELAVCFSGSLSLSLPCAVPFPPCPCFSALSLFLRSLALFPLLSGPS